MSIEAIVNIGYLVIIAGIFGSLLGLIPDHIAIPMIVIGFGSYVYDLKKSRRK